MPEERGVKGCRDVEKRGVNRGAGSLKKSGKTIYARLIDRLQMKPVS